jgi:hypothetical protein
MKGDPVWAEYVPNYPVSVHNDLEL